MYGAWYGAERAVVETLRTDSLYIPGTEIRVSSLLSALLCVACLIALYVIGNKIKEKEQADTYEELFADDMAEIAEDEAYTDESETDETKTDEAYEANEGKEETEDLQNADN